MAISLELRQRAEGYWDFLLPALGVDAALLDGKNRPCPFCGGKDRFRWTNHKDQGWYYCNQCGRGDGFRLAKRFTGREYGDLCREVEKLLGADTTPAPRRAEAIDTAAIRDLWDGGNDIDGEDPVSLYLKNRGLDHGSRALRHRVGLYDSFSGRTMAAMVAKILGRDRAWLGVHVTFIEKHKGRWIKARVDRAKRSRKIASTISGGAVRLARPDRHGLIGLAEGIETALAVRDLFGTPCWATLSTVGMTGFKPPEDVQRIIIYADNDTNFAGQRAAYETANRLVVQDGFTDVTVRIPPKVGDYLDGKVADWFGRITRKKEN